MNDLVRLLFHEVADLPEAERERVFTARAVAPEVRAEVESLIGFDSDAEHVLTGCVAQVAQSALQSSEQMKLPVCGPYRLLRLLGSGGMGSVYLAERVDGEIQQQVAIKFLRAGANRPSWNDRFLKERQLLAYLNHPSVTRLLDAGHTADGQPYLAMEYVEGIPLDIYAAGKDLREQLTLFLRVCEGVAHAHRHLIIHRDLKPSNILVDASGHPKLLDFGIAKLLDETGNQTQTAEQLLTPNYASPEQLRGLIQTTATDVYSLGAVLYKLVTGRSPHESETGESRAIDVVAGRAEIPAARRLKHSLPADIDAILRTALRSESSERYASVEAFANDVRAFLESKPVQARSGDGGYRARKFLRRYWVPVAAAAVVMASLSAGLYVANRQRVIAERRFQQLRQLSNQIFDLDRAIRNLPGSTEARQRLVAASLDYLQGLGADLQGDLDLTEEVADAYLQVARVQGVPTELNLGQFAKAEQSLAQADALTETVLRAWPEDRRSLFRSTQIARDRMILASEEFHRAEAIAYARRAEERSDRFLKRGDATEEERNEVAGTYANIALAYRNQHLYDDSLRNARQTVQVARTLRKNAHNRLSTGLSLLANALRAQGDLHGALEAIREARRIAEGPSNENETERMIELYAVLWRQGVLLGGEGDVSFGRPAEASQLLQQALDLTERAARRDPRDYASRSRLGSAARELGDILRRRDPERALEVYDLGIRRLSEVPNNLPARRLRAELLAKSSYPLRALHRNAEAKQRLDESLAVFRELKDDQAEQIRLDNNVYSALAALADYYSGQGDAHRAIETDERLLGKVMASKPDPFNDLRDASNLSSLYEALSGFYREAGDQAKAEAMAARRIELWQAWDRKLPKNEFVLRQLSALN